MLTRDEFLNFQKDVLNAVDNDFSGIKANDVIPYSVLLEYLGKTLAILDIKYTENK